MRDCFVALLLAMAGLDCRGFRPRNGALLSFIYMGVTNNLKKRVYQQKDKIIKEFAEKYNIAKLVDKNIF